MSSADPVLGLMPDSPLAALLTRELAQFPLSSTADVAAACVHLSQYRALVWPLPGQGATLERFALLAEIAALDLSLARLMEGHTDALAILAELGGPVFAGPYGVWAADSPHSRLIATPASGGYVLRGCKRYASGASVLARALVTARAPEGLLLLDVALGDPAIRRVADSWQAVGMAHSDSLDVHFDDVFVPRAQALAAPGAYLERPGFHHGGVGVAACWYGGALGCARLLCQHFAQTTCDDHNAAHLGAVVTVCHALQATLRAAANEIDADREDLTRTGARRALLVRSVVERGCHEILTHTHRATGPGALVFDAGHARRAADLTVYIRQHHAERDLAALGRLVLAAPETRSACR